MVSLDPEPLIPVAPQTSANSHDDVLKALELTPEERKALIEEARGHKTEGNAFFEQKEYERAVSRYEEALAVCPEDENDERSIYYANIAACYVMTESWKKAVESCTEALKCNPTHMKALYRRAVANERIGSWTSLSSALDDFKKLLELDSSNRYAQEAVKTLPNQIQIQQEKEKEEMMGKLKDLGNSFLGKFGLSLDNFKMAQDPNGGYTMSMGK